MKFDTKMERMRNRLDAITFVQQPPTLSMKIIGANGPQPEFQSMGACGSCRGKRPRLINREDARRT